MGKNKVRHFEPVFQDPPPLIHTGSKARIPGRACVVYFVTCLWPH